MTQVADEQAIARYRYMLKTAPPETIEQAHAEAFAQLTPEQRRQLLQTMGDNVPAAERALAEQGAATPQALARMATRAEIRQPIRRWAVQTAPIWAASTSEVRFRGTIRPELSVTRISG